MLKSYLRHFLRLNYSSVNVITSNLSPLCNVADVTIKGREKGFRKNIFKMNKLHRNW